MPSKQPGATDPAQLQEALEHHRAGRITQAELIYRKILDADEHQPDALHLLGLVAHQTGNNRQAAELVSRAILHNPLPQYYGNLGIIYHALGKLPEATESFQRAVDLDPQFADALNNLGSLLEAQGRQDEAIAQFRRAALARPGFLIAQINLAAALRRARRFEETILELKQVLAIEPTNFVVHVELANLLKDMGRPAQAIEWYEKALTLEPRSGFLYSNLGTALRDLTRLEEALEKQQISIQLDPALAEAHLNLAVTMMELGLVDEGTTKARRATELTPELQAAWSSYLLSLNYGSHSRQFVSDEHRRWARTHGEPMSIAPARRSLTSSDRLRVGYLSADFRNHPIAFFLEPLLANHDRSRFEVTCYSDVLKPDVFTRRLQASSARWREASGMSHEDLARQIREDGIDILVDLAGHTAGNRLSVLALRPAARQIAYLGYPTTTGLGALQHRLTDAIVDPPGDGDPYYTEKLIRLPQSLACYAPPVDAPEIAPLPAATRGFITFASFTNLAKLSPDTISLWSRAMGAIPGSRLLLAARGADGLMTGARLRAAFASHGVDPTRLDVRGAVPMLPYLLLHNDVDVLLDTIPFNGHTTLCHALWMGVPVISLSGDRFAARLGKSVLTNVGLSELCAASADDFARIAISLADDVDRLASLRGTLRERMRSSPLMQADRFTRAFEDALLECWQSEQ